LNTGIIYYYCWYVEVEELMDNSWEKLLVENPEMVLT